MDYGRLNGLRELNVETTLSTMEQLVLAKARCYQVVYKVVAHGSERSVKHEGHGIIFPHSVVSSAEESGAPSDSADFSLDLLRAAVENTRVLFVGPKGTCTQLERQALLGRIASLKLRPEVLFNHLLLQARGGSSPTLERIKQVISQWSLGEDIRFECRRSDATEKELAKDQSDVAGVRSVGPERSAAEEDSPLDANHFGVLEAAQPDFKTLFDAVGRCLAEQSGNEDSTDARKDGNAAEDDPTYVLQRDATPIDDYASASRIFYDAFWYLVPLKQGFVEGRPCSSTKMKHMFKYYDCRYVPVLNRPPLLNKLERLIFCTSVDLHKMSHACFSVPTSSFATL